MKTFKLMMLFAATISMLLSGCTYANIQMPLDTDYDATELGAKVGRASNHAVLYLFAWGDAGSNAAAKNGDIKVIRHADREVFSILFGLYTRNTTVVYGD